MFTTQSLKIHRDLDTTLPLQFDYSADIPSLSSLNSTTKERLESIKRDGFVIIPNLLSTSHLKKIRDEVGRLSGATGRNNFEGRKTLRPYGILGKSRVFDPLLIHDEVVSLLDQLLLPNYLVTATQAIEILPGESPQPFHTDDSFCRIPRPRQHLSVGAIWAIDEFTSENGATVIVPSSHTWPEDRLPQEGEGIPCVMPPGSVVVFLGTLWHAGGANVSDQSRMAITFQYCEPYIRQQENQFLSVPFDVARELPENIQSLLGYSIHPPFLGHSNGYHPLKALARL